MNEPVEATFAIEPSTPQAPPEDRGPAAIVRAMPAELTVVEMVAQVTKVQELMKALMKPGEHYGIIPGTGGRDKDGKETGKPTLLKPGAEKLCLMFRLDPQYSVEERFVPGSQHYYARVTCTLYHAPSGMRVASGVGSCSTMEKKYATRMGAALCPDCQQPAITRSKYPPRDNPDAEPGWFCFGKKGGCNAQFDSADLRITAQSIGEVANPNLPDVYNTVVKMACKRALIAGVLNATAASDIFTQDLEDLAEAGQLGNQPAAATPTPAARPAQAAPQPAAAAKPAPQTAGAQRTGGGKDNEKPASEPQKKAVRALLVRKMAASYADEGTINRELGTLRNLHPDSAWGGLGMPEASTLIRRLNDLPDATGPLPQGTPPAGGQTKPSPTPAPAADLDDLPFSEAAPSTRGKDGRPTFAAISELNGAAEAAGLLHGGSNGGERFIVLPEDWAAFCGIEAGSHSAYDLIAAHTPERIRAWVAAFIDAAPRGATAR